MFLDDSWDIFYELRHSIAVAGDNFLDLPVLRGGEYEKIIYAAARQTVGGAKPSSLGVLIGDDYHIFETILAPAANEVIANRFEITLGEGMRFRAEFLNMAGAEIIELFVHGFRKFHEKVK